jgi:hypothetical protein
VGYIKRLLTVDWRDVFNIGIIAVAVSLIMGYFDIYSAIGVIISNRIMKLLFYKP